MAKKEGTTKAAKKASAEKKAVTPKKAAATKPTTKSVANSKVNKSQLIKDALAKSPTASPAEIAASVGHGITAAYVSVIKSNLKKPSARKRTNKKPGRRPKQGTASFVSASGSIDDAIKFIEESGGLKQAKAAIEKIERIMQL